MTEVHSRLNTQERKVLGKLDEQDVEEMLRRAGLQKQFHRRRGLVAKEERKHAAGDLETNYNRTYKGHYNYPQRASRRPIVATDDHSQPGMDFTSQTAKDFVPKPVHQIELVKKKQDNYQPGSAKVEGKSSYMADYPAKSQKVEFARRPDFEPAGAKIRARFDDRTMHKEHYKSWVGRDSDKLQFRELNPVADSIIFPKGAPLNGVSETKQQFPGKFASKPEAARIAPATVKLGIEGDFDHATVNRETYKSMKGEKSINYKPVIKAPLEENKQPFCGVSNYMADYRDSEGHGGPRAPVLPQPNNIALDPHAKARYDTWQKESYQGIDVTKHHRPAEVRYDHTEYHPPTEKMLGVTETKESYPGQDINLCYNPPKRTNIHERAQLPKFDDRTMHGEFYTAWPIQTRERFGDFKEHSRQIPIHGDFYGETTTARVFTPKKYEKTEAFIPEQKPINHDGEHDFNTVYRTTYKLPKYKLDAEEYAILQGALKKVATYGGVQNAIKGNCRSRSVDIGA